MCWANTNGPWTAIRAYEPDQSLLLPPSLDDWVPDGHLARFIGDTVDQLDLKLFFAKYEGRDDGRGRIAFHPRMMLKVLIYGYCRGIFSSRKTAEAIDELVPLRYLAAGIGRATERLLAFGWRTWSTSRAYSCRWCRSRSKRAW